MLPLIENKRKWKSYYFNNVKVFTVGNINEIKLRNFISKIQSNLGKIQSSDLKNEILKFKGNFAVICIFNNDYYFAFVDRIKSFPIYVGITKSGFRFSNFAPNLRKEIKNKNLNNEAILSIKMAGYAIGRNTLYLNIFQLLPGEICIINKKKIYFQQYYHFINKKTFSNNSLVNLSKKLSLITLSILKKMIKKNNDSKFVIPLSAGYDSRLIVSGLKYLNVKNVICFSYGRGNNFEARVAEKIAKKLGYNWYFVELNGKKQRINFNSKNYSNYKSFSDTLNSWSYVQDLFAVDELLKKNIIDNQSVIINGNSGDFISGGHLPNLKTMKNKSTLDEIIYYFLDKHFCLWINTFHQKDFDSIKSFLISSLPNEMLNIEKSKIYKIYEYLEFVNRQSNYVIQGQRVYDFYNLKWELPLWDDKYLDFWNKVPYDFKFQQKLYKYMLIKNNWGDVWHNIPLNPIYVSPSYMRYIRNFLKVFFVFRRRKSWHNFDKKFISYFIETLPHYSYFNYFKIINNSRIARNAISWHVEEYLRLKGIK